MKIYLACGGAFQDYLALKVYETTLGQADRAPPPRMLLSYHYFTATDMREVLGTYPTPEPLDVFADSGAFSAASQGQDLDAQAYVEWALKWGDLFSLFAAPDVIGDGEATAKATESMLRQAPHLRVLPVFHVGEPWEFLDHWVKRCDYIALGGMVPKIHHVQLLRSWLVQAFDRIPAHVRVHGFGLTKLPLLTAFPWASVDSSTWTTSARYRILRLFNSRTKRVEHIDMRLRAELMTHREVLGQYGLKPTDALNTKYSREVVIGATILSWQRVEAWLTERRG